MKRLVIKTLFIRLQNLSMYRDYKFFKSQKREYKICILFFVPGEGLRLRRLSISEGRRGKNPLGEKPSTKKGHNFLCPFFGPGGIRTHDQGIMSPLRYRCATGPSVALLFSCHVPRPVSCVSCATYLSSSATFSRPFVGRVPQAQVWQIYSIVM